MSLDALRLANFKAFGPSQRVPLRPITLVFGANSSGKSSILHAMALAHHAVETGDLDTQRTRVGGESIDLGGFRQYVHRGQLDSQVEMAFELDPGKLSGKLASMLGASRVPVVDLAIGGGFAYMFERFHGGRNLEAERVFGGVNLERFTLEVDGAPMLSMSMRAGGELRLDRLDHGHPVFREILHGILALATTARTVRDDDFAGLAPVLDELAPDTTARREGLFPRIESPNSEKAGTSNRLLPVSSGRRHEDLAGAARLLLPAVLHDLVDGLSAALEDEIRRFRYLGPLRSYPPRHLAFSQHHDANWYAGGGYAWDVVRTRKDIRDRVNRWLGDADHMKTPYELRVRDLLPADTLPPQLATGLADSLEDLTRRLLVEVVGEDRSDARLVAVALAIESVKREIEWGSVDVGDLSEIDVAELVASFVEAEPTSEEWVQRIVEARREIIQDLVLIDKRSNTPVSHRDVGIGVSQVLPVLVSAYASTGKLIAIEQPEIHLHPALQAELGDVFLESALGELGNRFLIETHSEHLILRILRRIRETSEGDLLPGATPVKPEDVAVLYVQPGPEGAEIIELPITPDGEFERRWPDGFFAERAKELF